MIGASPRAGSIGGELFRNILRGGLRRRGISGESLGRLGCRGSRVPSQWPRLASRSISPLCVYRAKAVLEAAAEALRAGVRALCVISAGFAETGPAGQERQDRLVELVRASGARLLGPNCLGIAVSASRLNATFGPRSLPAGRVGFSSQSGALGLAVAGARGRAGTGSFRFRFGRQQGGRFVQRPARVLGGRRKHRCRSALPRILRESAQVRSSRSPRSSQEADRGHEGRPHSSRRSCGQLAYRSACRVGGSSRCVVPPGRRFAGRQSRGIA